MQKVRSLSHTPLFQNHNTNQLLLSLQSQSSASTTTPSPSLNTTFLRIDFVSLRTLTATRAPSTASLPLGVFQLLLKILKIMSTILNIKFVLKIRLPWKMLLGSLMLLFTTLLLSRPSISALASSYLDINVWPSHQNTDKSINADLPLLILNVNVSLVMQNLWHHSMLTPSRLPPHLRGLSDCFWLGSMFGCLMVIPSGNTLPFTTLVIISLGIIVLPWLRCRASPSSVSVSAQALLAHRFPLWSLPLWLWHSFLSLSHISIVSLHHILYICDPWLSGFASHHWFCIYLPIVWSRFQRHGSALPALLRVIPALCSTIIWPLVFCNIFSKNRGECHRR